MKNGKRSLAKKVTSFVLYVDQVSQIQAIVEATGADKDAQVLRDLIDEALIARRRKTAQQLNLPEQLSRPTDFCKQEVQDIQILLLKLVEQGEKARAVRGVCLELLQEILAEAYGARRNSCDLLMRQDPNEVRQSTDRSNESKEYAYSLTKQITNRNS